MTQIRIVGDTLCALAFVACTLSSVGLNAQSQADSSRKAASIMAKFVPESPRPKSFIADVPHALTQATRDSIDAVIRQNIRDTRGEIAVAVLTSVGEFNPYDVAVSLLDAWHVGRVDTVKTAAKKGAPVVTRTLGTVLLIVPKETAPDKKGRCWIASGPGTESFLSDSAGSLICGGVIIPHLKRLDYNGGVRAGVEAIAALYHADATRQRTVVKKP